MAILKGEIKRGFLRQIFTQAQAASPQITLATALNTFQLNSFNAVKSGHMVVSTAGNGKSVTFNIPQIGLQIMQDEVMAFSEELFGVYADALVALNVAGTNPTGDPAIFAQMLTDDRMQSISSVRQDFTLIRTWTNGLGVQQ